MMFVYSTLDARGKAIKEAIRRSKELEKQSVVLEKKSITAVIEQLQQNGCLTKEGGDFFYTPSMGSRLAVSKALSSDGWNEKILKKMQNGFRPPSDGAIFKFSIEEEGESTSGIKTVEAFITDWSPFPAAAAIAVHPSHPLLQGEHREDKDYFSGIWVRHALTGDLLPVWVCSWVRPDFGTGAVIVNPAHSEADLAFAKKVGLPIRFALAPVQMTADPDTWIQPPVIKHGKTTKTGNHDGLSVEQAMDRYFNELSQNRSAEKIKDISLRQGSIKIASSDLAIEPILEALLNVDPSQPVKIFCPTSEVENTLLFARLLWHDLYKQPFKPVVQLLQPVPLPKDETPNFELAALVSGPLDDAFKKQILSQCGAFMRNHSDLLTYPIGGVSPPIYAEIKKNLLSGNYHTAFKSLCTLQKALNGSKKNPIPAGYFACVYLLPGVDAPAGLDLSAALASIDSGANIVLDNQGPSGFKQEIPTSTSEKIETPVNSDVSYTASQSFMPPPPRRGVLENVFENGKRTVDTDAKVVSFIIDENTIANQFLIELQQKSNQLNISMELPKIVTMPSKNSDANECYVVNLSKDDFNRISQNEGAFDKLVLRTGDNSNLQPQPMGSSYGIKLT